MKKAKILIVEDEEPLRNVLFKQFSKFNYHIVTAKDGEEAISLFNSQQPDLVLLDIVLPKKSGIEVLEHIRIKKESKIPVLIISNLDEFRDKETTKNLNIQGYYVKSKISLLELSSHVSKLLVVQT